MARARERPARPTPMIPHLSMPSLVVPGPIDLTVCARVVAEHLDIVNASTLQRAVDARLPGAIVEDDDGSCCALRAESREVSAAVLAVFFIS